MKRFLSALMALCLVLSLSACAVAEDAVRVYALMGPTGIGMVQMMDQNDGTYAFTLSGAPDEVVAAVASPPTWPRPCTRRPAAMCSCWP